MKNTVSNAQTIHSRPCTLTSITELVVSVEIAQRPLFVGHALPAKFRVKRKIIPSGRFGQLLVARRVLEAVQILYVQRLAELLQCRVDIVALLLSWYHECDEQKCLAANEQRRASGRQWQLVQTGDVHVQYL